MGENRHSHGCGHLCGEVTDCWQVTISVISELFENGQYLLLTVVKSYVNRN